MNESNSNNLNNNLVINKKERSSVKLKKSGIISGSIYLNLDLNKNSAESSKNKIKNNLKYKVNVNQTRNKTESKVGKKSNNLFVSQVSTLTPATDEGEADQQKNKKPWTIVEPVYAKCSSETGWESNKCKNKSSREYYGDFKERHGERIIQNPFSLNYKNHQHFNQNRNWGKNYYDNKDGYRNNCYKRGVGFWKSSNKFCPNKNYEKRSSYNYDTFTDYLKDRDQFEGNAKLCESKKINEKKKNSNQANRKSTESQEKIKSSRKSEINSFRRERQKLGKIIEQNNNSENSTTQLKKSPKKNKKEVHEESTKIEKKSTKLLNASNKKLKKISKNNYKKALNCISETTSIESFQPSVRKPNQIEAPLDNQIESTFSPELCSKHTKTVADVEKNNESLLNSEFIPKISLVPLSLLLEDSCLPNIENIIRKSKQSAKIENEFSENDPDPFKQKLVDKISKMDKTCIKNIINNPTTKFDTALKLRARQRIHEEIRKQLRTIQVENPDSNTPGHFQPDEFIDANNIPQTILNHIKDTFGIDFLVEMVNDSNLVAGSEDELASKTAITVATAALNYSPLEELPNPNNNQININDSNSSICTENDNTNEIDKDLSKPDLMQKLKNMEMINSNKIKLPKSTENLSHKINAMQSEKENKTKSPPKKYMTSKRSEKPQKKSCQNDKLLRVSSKLDQSASMKEIETLIINSSSSSSSSDSSSDSESSSSSSSASSTCSSYKRRKRRKRMLEASVVHSFKRLILPTLSPYLRKKYEAKYSKNLSDSLSFIYDVCLNKLLRNSNLGQYERKILKKNFKGSNNEEALLFLQKNIKELYEQERRKFSNNNNPETESQNKKSMIVKNLASKSNNLEKINIDNIVSDTNCIADQLKLIAQHITEKCNLLTESSQIKCYKNKKITTSQCNNKDNKNNPVNVENEISKKNCNINEKEKNSSKTQSYQSKKSGDVDEKNSKKSTSSTNLLEEHCIGITNTTNKIDSSSLDNENSVNGRAISQNNHHIDDNASNKNISSEKNLLDEKNNFVKTTETTTNKNNNKNDVMFSKNNINSNKLSDNNIVVSKDIEDYNKINDNNEKKIAKKNSNQINIIDSEKNDNITECDDTIEETSDDEAFEQNSNNNNFDNENCISRKLRKSVNEEKLLTEKDVVEIDGNSSTFNLNIGNKNNNGILNSNFVHQKSLLEIFKNNQTFNNNDNLENLYKDFITNKFGDNVLNNLKEMDLKLMILQKRKMYLEEMMLKLQKDAMDIDLASMQLQNERFLLLNTAISKVNLPLTNLNTLFPFSLSQTIKNEPNPFNDYYSQIMSSSSIISSSSNNEDEDLRTSMNRKRNGEKSNEENQSSPEKGSGRKKRCQRDILIEETAKNVFARNEANELVVNSSQKNLSEAVQLFLINSERTSRKIAKKLQMEGEKMCNALRTAKKNSESESFVANKGNENNNGLNHDEPTAVTNIEEESLVEEIIENNSDVKNGFYFGFKSPITQIRRINEFIIASSEDGFLYKFNWETKELIEKFSKHNQAIVQFVINTNLFIYTVSLDGFLKKTSLENFNKEMQSVNIQEPLQSLDLKWSTAFIGTRGGNIFTYNLKTNKLSDTALCAVDGSVIVLKASKEGPRKILIVAAKGNQINIRDAVSGLLLRIIDVPHNQNIYSILLFGGILYCGSNKNEVHAYDFTTGNKMGSMICGNGAASISLYRKDYIFVGCYDGYIYVFNKYTNSRLDRFPASGHIITALEIIGQKIIASTRENTMEMMDLPKCVKK